MTRCPKCGAESIEVITDSGRIVQRHLRHECPKGNETSTRCLPKRVNTSV